MIIPSVLGLHMGTRVFRLIFLGGSYVVGCQGYVALLLGLGLAVVGLGRAF